MEARQLTAGDLRRLAEAVDGIRDVPAYVVWGESGPVITKDPPAPEEVIFQCMTKSATPDRTKLRSIALDPAVVAPDGKVMDVAGQFDAMFWSEAAVEKFVLPYYMHVGTPDEVTRILDAFNHASVAAMLHLPDSTHCVLTSVRRRSSFEVLTLKEFEASL